MKQPFFDDSLQSFRASDGTNVGQRLGDSSRPAATGPPNDTGQSHSTEIVAMISELEESKFLRLFKYFVDSLNPMRKGGYDIGQPAIPLDLPNVELQFKIAGYYGSLGGFTAAWIFQIAHAPAFLWQKELVDTFTCERLNQAFKDLKERAPTIQDLPRSYHPRTQFQTAYQGCDDFYFFTNICHDVAEDSLERFSETAHRLFSDIVGVPRERHPTFGIGTPETLVENGGSEARRFLVDLLNLPSSYYFVAREGRISIVPTIEHGAFLASKEGHNTSDLGLSTVATTTVSQDNDLSGALTDFECMINSNGTKEADFQDFLTKNPAFLFALDEKYCEIKSHVCLFDSRRERLVPDFMARIEDSDVWDVLEIKRPQARVTVSTGFSERASAIAARGISELLTARDFFSRHENRRAVVEKFGTSPYEPCLVLIIGRGRQTQTYQWSSVRLGFPKVKIVSYDYLFERAQRRAAVLRSKA